MGAAPRILCFSRGDGLGSRLLALGWGWRLAMRLDARLVFLWPPAPPEHRALLGAAMAPGELFDLRALALADDDRLRLVEAPFRPEPTWPRLDTPGVPRVVEVDPATAFDQGPILCNGGYQPILLPGETVAGARPEMAALLRSLPLVPALVRAREAVRRRIAGRSFVAVHARRGDIVTMVAALGQAWERDGAPPEQVDHWLRFYGHKATPRAALAHRIAKEVAAGRCVYLATEEPALRAAARARHGEAVIEPGADGLSPLQAAMLDVLVQADAERIHAGHSAFSGLAALLGDRPLEPLPVPGGADAFARDLDELLRAAGVGGAVIAAMTARLMATPLMQRRLDRLAARPARAAMTLDRAARAGQQAAP